MSALLKVKLENMYGPRMSIKEGAVLSEISKAKAKEESPEGMAIRAAQDPSSSTSTLSVIAEVSWLVSTRIFVADWLSAVCGV
jgi:DNA helicase-2/ATP-dependent DNA helicase PcrA